MGRGSFTPRYHPKAKVRKAREDAKYASYDVEQALLRSEQSAREREDDQRLRMMARLEPERYLRLVSAGQVLPRYRESALAQLQRRCGASSQHPRR